MSEEIGSAPATASTAVRRRRHCPLLVLTDPGKLAGLGNGSAELASASHSHHLQEPGWAGSHSLSPPQRCRFQCLGIGRRSHSQASAITVCPEAAQRARLALRLPRLLERSAHPARFLPALAGCSGHSPPPATRPPTAAESLRACPLLPSTRSRESSRAAPASASKRPWVHGALASILAFPRWRNPRRISAAR